MSLLQHTVQEQFAVRQRCVTCRHAVCRTASGRAFAWGWAQVGQLGTPQQTHLAALLPSSSCHLGHTAAGAPVALLSEQHAAALPSPPAGFLWGGVVGGTHGEEGQVQKLPTDDVQQASFQCGIREEGGRKVLPPMEKGSEERGRKVLTAEVQQASLLSGAREEGGRKVLTEDVPQHGLCVLAPAEVLVRRGADERALKVAAVAAAEWHTMLVCSHGGCLQSSSVD